MVDIPKLRSHMALKGHSQRSMVTELNARGIKISENTFSSKMNMRVQFDCEEADAICDVLEVKDPATKAEIFLATASH